MKGQLTVVEPKAQTVVVEPKAPLPVMFSTQNVSIVNHITQKLDAVGFTRVQSPIRTIHK